MNLPLSAEAIAFDLDDTLCDSREAKETALRSLATSISRKTSSQESFIAAYRLHEPRLYRAVLANHISIDEYKEQRFQIAVETCGAHPSEMAVGDLNNEYSRRLMKSVQLFPEVTSVLHHLHTTGYPLALIANGPADTQRKKIDALGIAQYFNVILISSEVRMTKPDKRIYEKAAHDLYVNLSGMIMVGDSLREDYYGAVNAGAVGVLIDRQGLSSKADVINRITNLKELPY